MWVLNGGCRMVGVVFLFVEFDTQNQDKFQKVNKKHNDK